MSGENERRTWSDDQVKAEAAVESEGKNFTLSAIQNKRGSVLKIKEHGPRSHRIVMVPLEGIPDFVAAVLEMERKLQRA